MTIRFLLSLSQGTYGFCRLDISYLSCTHTEVLPSLAMVNILPQVDDVRSFGVAFCVARNRIVQGGHKRLCGNSDCRSHDGGVHNTCYPRVDPVVIVLVESPDGNRCVYKQQSLLMRCIPTKLAFLMCHTIPKCCSCACHCSLPVVQCSTFYEVFVLVPVFPTNTLYLSACCFVSVC